MSASSAFWTLAACVAVLAAPAIRAAEDQRAVLELVVNEVPKGEAFVVLRGADALVGVARLREAGLDGFAGERETIDGEEMVSLQSLAASVTFSIDERDLTLVLTAAVPLLGERVRTLGSGAPPDMVYRSDTSAFLNYALNWNEGTGTDLIAESAFHAGEALLYGTWNAGDSGTRRGITHVTVDQRSRMRRWTFGDAFARTGPLGGDAWAGGITLTREFGIEPYFVRHPSLSLSAPVAVPSVVEVHVNGRIVSQEQVEPGRLDLRNLPLTVGRNDARVVVRDAFGTRQEISAGYYVAGGVLAPGVHDYQYSIGFRRDALGSSSWGYEEPVALARHRVGVTPSVTVGARAEASPDLVSLGPSVNLRLPHGELEAAGAVSGGAEGYGSAVLAGYTYAGRPVSAGASIMAATPSYVVLGARPLESRAALDASLFASVAFGRGVSLTAQHSEASLHGGFWRSRSALIAGTHLGRNVQLTASAARTRDTNGRGYEAFVGVTVQFGRTTASTSLSSSRNGTSIAMEAQAPLPVGIGYGYQARVETGTPGSVSGAVQYQTAYGRYELRHDSVAGSRRASVSAAGAVVAIGGELFASRPVHQSFALVRVPGVKGVRGFASNQEVGRTNANGDLLVPDLQAYYGNLLNISDSDIPLDYAVGGVRMTLAPPYRGGALAVFPVQLIRRVTGSVRIVDGGVERAPEYGEMRVTAPGAFEPAVSPLGGTGEFYFENLPPGRLDAIVQDGEGACTFTLEVPEADEALVDVGEIRCSVEGSR